MSTPTPPLPATPAPISSSSALRELDRLLEHFQRWLNDTTAWEPIRTAREELARELPRLKNLRSKLETPIVVATFGGTGTGKSTLVNALVGTTCTTSGRERPTTTRPILIAHHSTQLERLDFSTQDFEVVRIDNPLFQDFLLIDCPDPDTTEVESPGSNLERLHQLLPHCDCLIYTTTQQKYRSARVLQELARAAQGCRLLFVQTNADLDVDIREDWLKHLSPTYSVSDLFFVDSVRALQAQQQGTPLDGDFLRLRTVLSEELSASRRQQVRRANLLTLLQSLLDQAQLHCQPTLPHLTALEQAVQQERHTAIELLSSQLQRELQAGRRIWERQLLILITEYWGLSPFSAVLRIYNGLGAILASAALLRARSTTQVALVSALQGVRWLQSREQEQDAQNRLSRIGTVGLDDASLRQAQILISGFLHDARFPTDLLPLESLEDLRNEAEQVQHLFLKDSGQRMEQLLDQLAQGESRTPMRLICEVSFSLFLLFLLWRIGKNFFWDSFFFGVDILQLNFYVPALIFTTLLSVILIAFFTRHLSRGLDASLIALSRDFATDRMSCGLFSHVEQALKVARRDLEQLDELRQMARKLITQQPPQSQLGSLKPAP